MMLCRLCQINNSYNGECHSLLIGNVKSTVTHACLFRVSQIKAMVDAAEEDKMGRYAPGAMDRVVAGSKDALEKINRSAAK